MSNLSDNFIPLSGLGQVAGDYDVLLCDIWGVVHNGRVPYREACAALERFRQEFGTVILISNSPKPSVTIPEAFARIGVPGEFYDAIVTSGDATIDDLARRAPGPAFKIGPERDDALYDSLELHFSDLDTANFITCTGMFDDEDTPSDYHDLLTQALDRGLHMVCANPDKRVRVGDHIVYCGGALAEYYENMGGTVIYAGKPHEPIYRLTRAWMEELLGYVPEIERVLCIGDNILTDLLGAQNQGYDCLYIEDGLHGDTREKVVALLEKHKVFARYMARKLTW